MSLRAVALVLSLSKGNNLNAAEDVIARRLRRSQLWDCFVTSFLAMMRVQSYCKEVSFKTPFLKKKLIFKQII